MNVLDENIRESQRQLLRGWRIAIRQIGHEVGRQGMKDSDIIPLLHRLGSLTFFTQDMDFYRRHLCHADYCLVCLDVGKYEAASFIRRFLRHPLFNSQAKRMGNVVRVTRMDVHMWRLHAEAEEKLAWFM